MADYSQLSAEAIKAEIENLRQQIRSYAMQRAEGLIDATLQYDLVSDLKVRIAELEAQQNSLNDVSDDVSSSVDHTETQKVVETTTVKATETDEPNAMSEEHAQAKMIEEMLEAEADDNAPKEDTHEYPDARTIAGASDEAEHAESRAVEEEMKRTAEMRRQLSSQSDHAQAEMIDEMLEAETDDNEPEEDTHEHPEATARAQSSDALKHSELRAVEEAIKESAELRQQSMVEHVVDIEADELEVDDDTQTSGDEKLVADSSDALKHSELHAVEEAIKESAELRQQSMVEHVVEIEADDDTETSVDEKPVMDSTEAMNHAEMRAVEEAIKESAELRQQSMVEHIVEIEADETVSDQDNDGDLDETANAEDVTEEEHNPLRRDDEKTSLKLGDFVEDIVVSSAMVKEPDYLNEIHEPNVVDIRDITKTYKMGELELEVLKGITLQVRKGELISIMGPSGSGKSTLMNILGALDKPTSGEYFLDSVDVSKMNEKQLAEIRNSKIGFVFQSFNLLKRTSALRQVELPLIYGKHKDRTRRAREALEAVGLGQRTEHTPAELSGGQQQRVAIARALVSEPSLILADEPTGNLDSRSGTEVMQIFQNLNRQNNITTILVTHDTWIARHTDRVIMLRDGKIIADQRVKNPLVAGEAERPTETQELQALFETAYYGGDEEEYN